MAEHDDDDDDDDGDGGIDQTNDEGGGGASSKPILIVAILGLAALLAITTAVVLMKKKSPATADATPTETTPVPADGVAAADGAADPLADLLGGIQPGILDSVAQPTPAGAADATPARVDGQAAATTEPTPAAWVSPTPSGNSEPTPSSAVEPTPSGKPEPTPSGKPEPTPSSKPEPTPASKPEPTPASKPEPTPASKPEPTPASKPEPTPSKPPPAASSGSMSYDKEYLASLSGKAGSGGLTDEEIAHLKAAQGDTMPRAYALLAANYEAKKNYKAHCEVTTTVLGNSRYAYDPDWNLEAAKCKLRNGDWNGAAKAADNAISGQMDLAAATRQARVLLAYQIKARARTAQYEADAKANAGFGDVRILNTAIAAWKEVKNYATGIGQQKAIDDASREIDDLEARRPPAE